MATIWDDRGRIVLKIQSEKIINYIINNCNLSHQNGAYRFNEEEGITNKTATSYHEYHFYPGYFMVV